mmetsp:Transcript_107839/g.336319  ORF Transcript_107839/g.336319 Transcript_107839/m.336319 type:complete len:133 (-) Transcript_107839:143-541(-)
MMWRSWLAGPHRPSWSFNLLHAAWAALAKVYWPVVVQESFRLQLQLWAQCNFSAEAAQEHMLWDPLLFYALTSKRLRERAPEQLGRGREEGRAKLKRMLEQLMVKEARMPTPFKDLAGASARLDAFIALKKG